MVLDERVYGDYRRYFMEGRGESVASLVRNLMLQEEQV